MRSRAFVRVYHEDLMRDYPTVYRDDVALATWLRLLVIADKMWPSLPELPRSVRPRGLDRLTEMGLVSLVPPHHYRVRGYESERQSRQDAARNAAAVRWQSKGNVDSSAEAMPRTRAPVPRPSTSTETENLKKNGQHRARGMEKTGAILERVVR